jgi:molybdopterin-containing oxidoreductase family membrane subunit
MKRKEKAFWLLFGIGAIIGVLSILWRLTAGETLTALSSTMPWGIWVAFYTYFIGLSIGLFLFTTLVYVFGLSKLEKAGRLALISSVFALAAGMLFIWIDLGHPERFWRVITNWNYTSVLAWETLFYLFYVLALLASLWFLMRCDLADFAESSKGWKKGLYKVLSLNFACPKTENEFKVCHTQSMNIVKVIGILGIPAAIGAAGLGGALFAVVAAKPFWFSATVPIIFVISALASGTAMIVFLYSFLGKKDDKDYGEIVRTVAKFMVVFIVLIPLLLFFEALIGLYSGVPERAEVFLTILFGPFFYTFWVGQLLLGTIVPVLIFAFRRDNPTWLGLAGLSAVIGLINVRLNLVIPAFVIPPLKGLDQAYFDKRWSYFYFPSAFEWITTIFPIALFIFLFALAIKIFPIFGRLQFKLKGGSDR